MAFFDFLFIKEPIEPTEGADAAPEAEKSEQLDIAPGMQLDVVQEDGQQLLSGLIVSADFPQEIVLDRLPGALAFTICPAGTTVHVHGYTSQTIPFHLKATIKESTRILCRLGDLQIEPYVEARQSFRLPINADVSLFYEHDKYLENPEHCTLIDISTGGACFESEYIHAEGEVLRMKTQIGEYAPMTFLGEVIRVMETSAGVFRYGFLFAKLKEDEITALNRTLYNLQVGNRREWSRHGYGSWSS